MRQVLKMPNFLIRLVSLGAIVMQLFTTTALASTSATCATSYCAYLPSVQAASPFRLISGFTGSGHTGPQYIYGELINISTQTYANVQLKARLFNFKNELIGIVTGTVLTRVLVPGQLSLYFLDQYGEDVPIYPIDRFEIEPINLTVITTPTYKLLQVSVYKPDPDNSNIVAYQVQNNTSEAIYNTQLYVWYLKPLSLQVTQYTLTNLAINASVTRTIDYSTSLDISAIRSNALGTLTP